MYPIRITSLTALVLCTFTVEAFWRLECEGSVGLARLDPLMSFDTVGAHVHSIKGGSAFGPTSKASDLLNSNCTSCGVAQDMSAYWAPAMYFMHNDGTVEIVPEKPPHKSYYLLRNGLTHDGKKQTVEAFPNGFQMVAGNNFRRNTTIPDPDPNPLGPWPESSQDERAQRAIGFNCLHYAAGNDEPTLRRHKLPDKSFLDSTCTDGIRLEMQFPSCWNGELDGGPMHKTHVAYPDGVAVGNCPKGYDRRLITLFYETIVATDEFKGVPGEFVLANGDPYGFGYHGDFISAWKGDTLEKAVKQCDEQLDSGVMMDCPVFEMTKNSQQCKLQSPLPAPIAKEDVKGPLKGLVNWLQVAYGPEPAPKPAAPNAVAGLSQNGPSTTLGMSQTTPNALSSSTSRPPATQSAKPKMQEKVAVKPNPTTTASTTAKPAFTLKPGERTLSISSYTVGAELHEQVVVEVDVTVTVPVVTTTMAYGKRDRHVRRHVHHRHMRPLVEKGGI